MDKLQKKGIGKLFLSGAPSGKLRWDSVGGGVERKKHDASLGHYLSRSDAVSLCQ